MNTKFKLTNETKVELGVTLYRIKALKDFGDVKKGEKGGWVQNEANASESGDAWVYGNASVSGDAWVYGNARVYGNASVSGNARVYGNASVSGEARVSGDAWVYGNARVYGDASVSGDARVYGNASVSGEASVYGDARVYGDAWVHGKLKLKGGWFFGIRYKSEKVQEIEISNGDYLIGKGDIVLGVEDATTEAIALLERNGYKIVKK